MTTAPSNLNDTRRITPQDEAFLRRFRAEMKFDHAGPFVTLLDPIRPVKPERGPSGIVLSRQPRYAATSAESWTVGSRIGSGFQSVLEAMFGREWGSVLDDEATADAELIGHMQDAKDALKPKRRRRRGSRGGRKPVTS